MGRRKIGVAVIGMGWMGQVHSRAWLGAPQRFPDLAIDVELAVCADASEELAARGAATHGFGRHTVDWHDVLADSKVDVVSVTTPNNLHADICCAAAAAGKHVWCEKPVGRNAAEAARVASAAARAGIVSMSGFNYHWAPMVQHVRELLANGELGEVELFRGRFYSMYAHDRLGLYGWRFQQDLAGSGAVGDLLSHVSEMAISLVGPLVSVCAHKAVFVPERPLPKPGAVSHYARGAAGDPTAKVENEDYVGVLAKFANGARGSLEGWRTACGPKSDMGFELYCTNGSVKWSLESLNELQVYLHGHGALDGYTRVLAGERHPDQARFVPGDGNSIGYEDTKIIEVAKLLSMMVAGEDGPSGLQQASCVAQVGAAVLRACESGQWEAVEPAAT